MQWQWEEVDETRSGSSGDISKLFKNEPMKHPGALTPSAPPADATLLAREVIQNAWDAARDLRADLRTDVPNFDVVFSFERLEGETLRDVNDSLGYSELSERAATLDWSAVGLPPKSCLLEAHPTTLDTLRIDEYGSSGMYGPWSGAKSKMYLALVSLGYTVKLAGSGGSYGYGKAGLIRGSQTRTVVAYSCFKERADDAGVTRRLLGMTYWGPHDVAERGYTGFARLGSRNGDVVEPFENDEADAHARALGLEVRDPADVEQLGTSFLLLDPTVQPEDLRVAVERSWWPALESDNTFDVAIIGYAGESHTPRPKRAPELAPFIRGFELARMQQDNNVPTERRYSFQPFKTDSGRREVGVLGLVADPSDWSYPPRQEGVDHRSLVALVRSPRMVVEYFEAGQSSPFVRGTFVAHNDVDDLLRQTEPRGHDAWQTTPGDDSTDPNAPVVAKKVLDAVKRRAQQFRGELKPPVPDRREIRLPDLEKLFGMLINGDGADHAAPPPAEPRPVAISILEQHPEADPHSSARIRLRARVAFSLSDNFTDGDSAGVEVTMRYKFLEDNRAGEDCGLELELPEGFVKSGEYTARGRLGRDPVVFTAVSDSYLPDWTGRLVAEADLVSEEVTA